MFQWDKSIKTLDVAVGQVIQLFRSMRDVQLALPGLPAQEASAYLCQYQTSQGVGTTAIFALHKSGQLAFYVNTPREVGPEKAETMLDQALVFVESMGFLLTDLDIHLLTESDREMLWASLPLQKGTKSPDKSPPTKPIPAGPAPAPMKLADAATVPDLLPASVAKVAATSAPTSEPEPVGPVPEQNQPERILSVEADRGEQANVDELLAAVEELRTRRPGVRTRKKPPSPEELKRRRQELRENIGRILVSL
jgi:hypothetical protein